MRESPESDLASFAAEDMDELVIGLGEMTGLDDEHVHMLLKAFPEFGFPVTVRAVGATAKEQAKGLFTCLEMTCDGITFRLAGRMDGGRKYIGEVSSSDGKTSAFVRFDQGSANGSGPDDRTRDIDDKWN